MYGEKSPFGTCMTWPIAGSGLILLIGLWTTTRADTVAFSFPRPAEGSPSAAGTDGYVFVPLVDVVVTDLGYYDHDLDGLTLSHEVAIFEEDSRAKLRSAMVDESSTLDGLFRFSQIQPLALEAETTYVLAGHHPGVLTEDFAAENPNPLTIAPEIEYVEYRIATGNSLTWPDVFTLGTFFGPNFKFQTDGAIEPPILQAGDANQDLVFDQRDVIRVSQAAKYLSASSATWGEGDWNGAPGGSPGNAPLGDGRFDQRDIVAALAPGFYLTGPYGAVNGDGREGDAQTSVGYDARTGRFWVDAPTGRELTSVNIDSNAGIFVGPRPMGLDGSFDSFASGNIFKATFGSRFGSLSFGEVASIGLTEEFLLSDLSVIGSLSGGGGLGDVDLIFVAVPEPSSLMMLALAALSGIASLVVGRRSSRSA
jgi:hypothetical protein